MKTVKEILEIRKDKDIIWHYTSMDVFKKMMMKEPLMNMTLILLSIIVEDHLIKKNLLSGQKITDAISFVQKESYILQKKRTLLMYMNQQAIKESLIKLENGIAAN